MGPSIVNIRLSSLPAMVYVDSMAHSVPHESDFMAEVEMNSQMGPQDYFLILCHKNSSLTCRRDMSQRSDGLFKKLDFLESASCPSMRKEH